jgi:hypothetical protein
LAGARLRTPDFDDPHPAWSGQDCGPHPVRHGNRSADDAPRRQVLLMERSCR